MKRLYFFKLVLVVFLFLVIIDKAKSLPAGYIIPKETLSSNRKYGFMVPVFDLKHSDALKLHDSLVNITTGKVITEIDASPGFDQCINYINIATPWWADNESLVLWKVNGKWAPTALVLIKLKDNKQSWQLNLLKSFQKEILSYTKKAAPEKYEAAKKANFGCGVAYSDGFTIDIEPIKYEKDVALKLPLEIHVTLTSNPKQLENFPNLNAEMDGIIKEGGVIQIKQFKIL